MLVKKQTQFLCSPKTPPLLTSEQDLHLLQTPLSFSLQFKLLLAAKEARQGTNYGFEKLKVAHKQKPTKTGQPRSPHNKTYQPKTHKK